MALHDRKRRTLARYWTARTYPASGPFPAGPAEVRLIARADGVSVAIYRPTPDGRLRPWREKSIDPGTFDAATLPAMGVRPTILSRTPCARRKMV